MPRYIGPYPILKRTGDVAYKLKLRERLVDVHDVFHVSQLRKCLRVPEEQVVPDTLDLQDDLRYQEVSMKILDTVTKRTRMKAINNGVVTQKLKRHGKKKMLYGKSTRSCSRSTLNLEGKIPSKWSRSVTPRNLQLFQIFSNSNMIVFQIHNSKKIDYKIKNPYSPEPKPPQATKIFPSSSRMTRFLLVPASRSSLPPPPLLHFPLPLSLLDSAQVPACPLLSRYAAHHRPPSTPTIAISSIPPASVRGPAPST
jgi:hypothetical protein